MTSVQSRPLTFAENLADTMLHVRIGASGRNCRAYYKEARDNEQE